MAKVSFLVMLEDRVSDLLVYVKLHKSIQTGYVYLGNGLEYVQNLMANFVVKSFVFNQVCKLQRRCKLLNVSTLSALVH